MSYDQFPYAFRPIDRWPAASLTRNRRRSPFRARWAQTMSLLSRELRFLQARNVVLQIAMQEKDLRLDGKPRAHARAEHPGVILAFDSRFGPLKYAVDTYTEWQDNIRAISLALQALRAVDRYGVTKRGEQYTGWKAIPQHTGSGFETAADAEAWMLDQDGAAGDAWDSIDDVYRRVARRLHPDSPDGSHDEFVKLQAAYKLVKEAEQAAV